MMEGRANDGGKSSGVMDELVSLLGCGFSPECIAGCLWKQQMLETEDNI